MSLRLAIKILDTLVGNIDTPGREHRHTRFRDARHTWIRHLATCVASLAMQIHDTLDWEHRHTGFRDARHTGVRHLAKCVASFQDVSQIGVSVSHSVSMCRTITMSQLGVCVAGRMSRVGRVG